MSDFAALVGALGVAIPALCTGAYKIWAIVADCNRQLSEMAAEAEDRRALAEKRISSMSQQLESVLQSNQSLKANIQELERKISQLTEALNVSHTDNMRREKRIFELEAEVAQLRSNP